MDLINSEMEVIIESLVLAIQTHLSTVEGLEESNIELKNEANTLRCEYATLETKYKQLLDQ